ncbi:MAG: polymer-forming cytoskeletal protein [Polyangiaceae bacterium]
MANETTIAAGTVVRGSIEGTGNLVVAGHVEGDVQLSGEVTVESTGLVGANVRASRIVVRGAVRGDLSADEAVVLEEGARVVGDVRAARIAVGRGALVRGYVETKSEAGKAPVARAAERAVARPAPAPARVERPAPPPPPARVERPAPPPPKKVEAPAPVSPRPSMLVGLKREPPPPVVPALKKGAKAVKKKSI